MSCTTCPTTNCTCCHVHNVTIDYNLSVGNNTTLTTCGNSGGALTVNTDSTCSQTSGDLVVINGTSGQSALNVSAGNLYVTENISCQQLTETSDARLKTNVRTIQDALGIVQRMDGVRFDWLAADDEHEADTASNPVPSDGVRNNERLAHIGLIAQDVQTVLPEVVHKSKDGRLSVAYTNIVAVLVEAVKELTVKVTLLEENANANAQA